MVYIKTKKKKRGIDLINTREIKRLKPRSIQFGMASITST